MSVFSPDSLHEDPEAAELRRDARAVIAAYRAFLANPAFTHNIDLAVLAKVAADENVAPRDRRRAAEMLARYRLTAMETDKHEKQWRIELPGGGSVTVKSADNPDALRGVGLDGVVLDEAAFMAEAAWINGLRPALSDRQGWAIFLTTPNGMNWFHGLFESAGTNPGWVRWQRPTSDNPRIPAEELVAARRDMGELTFRQEHLAEFVIAGAGLFKPDWMEHRYDALDSQRYRLADGDIVMRNGLSRFAVADLAVSTRTTADYTVIGVFGITPDKRLLVLDMDRKRREGPDIVPAMQAALDRWDAKVLWVEKAGFQLALIQEARRHGLPVREIQPDRDKVSRAMPATAALEGGRVILPRAASWLTEFRNELLSFPETWRGGRAGGPGEPMSGKTKVSDPTRAVAYIRCSTDRQDLSPDAQRHAIETWARRSGIQILAFNKDLAVSGGAELESRPGLLAALEALRQDGAGHLVVAKRDRLARDVLTAALVERLCEREGASIASADGTGNGEGPEAQLLRGFKTASVAIYHTMGQLPEPDVTHRFC